MVILGIISLCAMLVLIVVNAFVLLKKSATSSMTEKDYLELRSYIQMCFDEQNKINEKINMLIVNSMAKNNDSVINTVTQKVDEVKTGITEVKDSVLYFIW